MLSWTPLTSNQVRVGTDARQYFDVLTAAESELSGYPGWMFWKKYPNGREYLVHALDRTGKGTTLGSRAKETEARHAQFKDAQAKLKLRARLARDHVDAQARFVKAARLNRLPRAAADVARAFASAGLQDEFLIVGTHALYAYEAMADVMFLPHMMETQDMDVLWDAHLRVQAITSGNGAGIEGGALGILKQIDETYTRNEERTFQAINSKGFAVELLRAAPPEEPPLIAPDDRINPMALPGLQWLLVAPMAATVFDQAGQPLTIRVPDPRIFAAHKLWLAGRKDRKAGKRDRDRAQAEALAEIVSERIPVLDKPSAKQRQAVAELAPQFAALHIVW